MAAYQLEQDQTFSFIITSASTSNIMVLQIALNLQMKFATNFESQLECLAKTAWSEIKCIYNTVFQ